MATGGPPWEEANVGNETFNLGQKHGIAELAKAYKKPLPDRLDELVALMVEADPSSRPTAEKCLSHPWFQPMSGKDVSVHSASRLKPSEPPSDCPYSFESSTTSF